MKIYPKCDECPLRDKQCIQEYTGHKPFCDWVKRGGMWLEKVIELSNSSKEALFPIPKLPELPKDTSEEFPSTLEQGKNFVGSMVNWAKSGFKKVSSEEHQRRLEICEGCEFLKDKRCLKCGCFVKPKASMESEHCPIHKW